MRDGTKTSRGYDRDKQKRRAVGVVFGKTNRILARDNKVQVHTSIPDGLQDAMHGVPGFTVYPNIYMNLDMFGPINKPETMIQLLGLNYHELAHVLFTPRKFKASLPAYLRRSYNILEDQRIESFFTAQYEPAGKFFTEMVIRFIVGNQAAWQSAFLWTHGRSFLPLEIREEFEARFALPHQVEVGKQVIEKYKTFTSDNFENNRRAVVNTIIAFHNILEELENNGNKTPEDQCNSSDQSDGKVDEQKEQQAAKEDRKKRNREKRTGEDQSNFWDEDEDEEDEEDGTDDGSEGDGEDFEDEDSDEADSESGTDDDSEDGDSDDDGEGEAGDDEDGDSDSDSEEHGDGSGEGDSDEDDHDSDVDGGSDSSASGDDGDGEETDGEGGGIGEEAGEPQFSNRELREYLDEIVEAVSEDESVETELGRIYNAINDSGNIDFIEFEEVSHDLITADLADVQFTQQITDNLRRLYAEVEPGWRYGSDVGKLNVGRAMLDPEDYENHFDEWEEGREHETGLEAVFAVDLSGSMHGRSIHNASKALWMLKRGLEEVEAKVTVLGFHEGTFGLLDRDTKMDRNKWPLWTDLGPDTLPPGSFEVARQILNASPMPNKLFVAITDGGWGSYGIQYINGRAQNVTYDNSQLIAAIPGVRMYVGVGGGGGANLAEQELFHTRKTIQSSEQLVSLVATTVDLMMKERLHL